MMMMMMIPGFEVLLSHKNGGFKPYLGHLRHGFCDAVGDVRGVMREKFGDKVKFRHFGGPRTFLGAPIGAASGGGGVGFAAAAAAAAAANGFGGGSGGGGGEWLGMEQRLVESVLHSVEERMAFGRFEP